ncbi:glycoside hydrolase family 13 protein [Serpula lacrymans var. lacrymans S7.3]|uniref:alpha-amylase n=1 Tax=Serpula lacrymans var. lacrymans (strain S7.3) TaxID=936435 RepID=F8QC66_SERL3|nr:glycoside hydrolase family 13 protein [Serpula lacrymans var. lacrymans S7.3]
MISSLTVVLTVVTFFTLGSYAATADQWRSRSIYQLVTDRFALANDSSSNSNVTCDTSLRQYCGGTWQGIIDHLDYIQDMGFDAVWISPVVANIENTTAYGQAYHGYWTQDMTSLNPHFGTAEDLKNLSAALHARDMYLMLDVVVNDMVSPNGLNLTSLVPFSAPDQFHQLCYITDDNNQTEVQQCWPGDSTLPRADINTDNPSVVTALETWISGVVQEYGVDGIRLDSAKHIHSSFWAWFTENAGVFSLGEVLSNDTSYVAPYTQVMDAVLEYPSYYPLVSAFSSPQGNLSALVDTIESAQNIYKSSTFMTGTFLENHDQPRFTSLTNDTALITNAITWPFITDGIPVLYYGQEQGYQGGSDPNNREALWLSNFDTNGPYVSHMKTLNAARKAAIAPQTSYFLTNPMTFMNQSNSSMLAVSKPPMIALLTNVGSNATEDVAWTVHSAFGAHEYVIDVLTCNTIQADSKGGMTVKALKGMPQVLMPMNLLGKSRSLCPNFQFSDKATGAGHSLSPRQATLVVIALVGITLAFV